MTTTDLLKIYTPRSTNSTKIPTHPEVRFRSTRRRCWRAPTLLCRRPFRSTRTLSLCPTRWSDRIGPDRFSPRTTVIRMRVPVTRAYTKSTWSIIRFRFQRGWGGWGEDRSEFFNFSKCTMCALQQAHLYVLKKRKTVLTRSGTRDGIGHPVVTSDATYQYIIQKSDTSTGC